MAYHTTKSRATANELPVTSRRLCTLKPHQMQDDWFAPLSEPELVALADSMARDGLQHPIHILRDGTILAGHQRVAAARRLGWKTIRCIVRTDLGDDPNAAALFAISDNVHRRQMGPLELARAYRALREIEQRGMRSAHTPNGSERSSLRDRLAKQFNRSGRQLDRLLRLLDLPLAVQLAISDRRLTVSMAERLLMLDADKREVVGKLIGAGEDPKSAIGRFTGNATKRRRLACPEAAEIRSDLLAVMSVFQSGHFDAYVRSVIATSPDAPSAEMLRRAQGVAHLMHQRLSKYVRFARVAG